MPNRFKRDLGAIDAQKDDNFEDHFIEVQSLEKIIDNDSDIIYGLKGSGKTALCRALTEINSGKYYSTMIIDLDNISFSQIHAALEKFKITTNKEIVKLASNTWRNVLLLYGLESISEQEHSSLLASKVNSLMSRGRYENPKTNNRLIAFIQNLLIKIKRIGLAEPDESPLGLTMKQIEEIEKSYDDELFDLLKESNEIVSKTNKKVLICLDGFDSILDHTSESRNAIFSGLVDAIYKFSKDKFISENFCFKAFLPVELTDEVRNAHFDADKFIFNTHYLNWSTSEFEKLVLKRMMRFSRSKSTNFKDVWNEFLPEKITNPVHLVDENTFSYILRHTLHRPRHLLIHLQFVFDEWDKKFSASKIDPSFIAKIICKTNTTLAGLIAGELEYTVPGITQFLHSWNGISSTISMSLFRDKVKKMFVTQSHLELGVLIDKLYNLGIIGYTRESDSLKMSSNSIGFYFSYVNGALGNRKIYNALEDKDIIALSPVFQEYCGCKFSEFGVVSQK